MRGHNPAWANLPRRKCDDCGKSYKPVQPLKEGQRGFCSANCRKSYHKHGGAYRKLKAEMQKMVMKHMAAINDANQTELRILCDRTREEIVRRIVREEIDALIRQTKAIGQSAAEIRQSLSSPARSANP